MLDDKWYFIVPDLDESKIKDNNELPVHCPYHDDNKISASINTEKNVFNCLTCEDKKGSLDFLLKEKFGFGPGDKINEFLESKLTNYQVKNIKTDKFFSLEMSQKFHFSPTVLNDLKVFKNPNYPNSEFSLPVFIEESLFDVRTYFPAGNPKWRGEAKTKTGLIIPYDIWKNDKRPTLICAGEKDMLIARSKGFNAITITGGENRLPRSLSWFKNKEVVIVYDNDDTGRKGAVKLASNLLKVTSKVKNVTSFHDVCIHKGEDIYDFFIKYGKNEDDLSILINYTPYYTMSSNVEVLYETLPLTIFHETLADPDNYNKLHRSIVKLQTDFSQKSAIPKEIEVFYHYQIQGVKSKIMEKGREPFKVRFDSSNLLETLKYLNEQSPKAKEKMIEQIAIRQIYDQNKDFSLIQIDAYQPKYDESKKFYISAAVVTSKELKFGEKSSAESTQERLAFYNSDITRGSTDVNVGDEIEIVYRISYDPSFKGQNKLVVHLHSIVSKNQTIDNFEISQNVISSLIKFQPPFQTEDTLQRQIDRFYEMGKVYLAAPFMSKELFLANELLFHSVLMINHFGAKESGVLEGFVCGDTQGGKSSVTKNMINHYGVGISKSISSPTFPGGLIGGSYQIGNISTIKPGIIPNSNKKLLVLEEFQTAKEDVLKIIREFRTSKVVDIVRVSNQVSWEANLRFMIISNPPFGKPIKDFPRGGVEIIQKLIPEGPDISRFDYFLLVPPKPRIDLTTTSDDKIVPFDKEDYQNRINWVWSRKPENILIGDKFTKQLNKAARWLEEKYLLQYLSTQFPIFGQNLPKKIFKIAIAFAGILVSTSDFINIYVREEHIALATKFLDSLYDNDNFKILQEIERERVYDAVALTEGDVVQIKSWIENAERSKGIEKLALSGGIYKEDMKSEIGTEQKDADKFFSQLSSFNYVKIIDKKLIPSRRFKAGYNEALRRIKKENHGR